MKGRILLCRLAILVFLNLCFLISASASDTYTWTGNGGDDKWTNPANWKNDGPNGVPDLPPDDADVEIIGMVMVTIYEFEDIIVESVYLKNGAVLTVEQGATLTTRKGNPGNESLTLDGNGSKLMVSGTINLLDLDENLDIGLFADDGTFVTISSTGFLNIPDYGGVGIGDDPSDHYYALRVDGNLTNNGSILITDPFDRGILVGNGGVITNENTLTISGGVDCINFRSNGSLTNNGTIILSGASDRIITGGADWEFVNNGTLKGDGEIKSEYFVHGSGSILAPGTSPGVLTFSNSSNPVNLSGVNLQIEINGTTPETQYDQIKVTGSGNLILTGSTIFLSGTHTPMLGNSFNIFTGSNIVGAPGGSFVLNRVLLSMQDDTGMFEFDSVLPITLTSFTARPIGKAVQLDWATATETNNDYFSIEHSTDGRTFSEIGRLTGAGTTQEEQRYAFVHRSPEAGLNYYRLDQRDFDGAHEYSPVQTAVIEGKNTWTAWPTLARDVVNLEWVEAPKGSTVVEVFNAAGQKVYRQPAPQGAVRVQVPVQQWAPGTYWVVVQDRGGADAQWFMKE